MIKTENPKNLSKKNAEISSKNSRRSQQGGFLKISATEGICSDPLNITDRGIFRI